MKSPIKASARLFRLGSPALVTAVVFLAGLAGSWLLFWRADSLLRAEFLQRAALVAKSLEPEAVQALNGTAEDLDRPEYLRLKKQLASARQAAADSRFIYLLGRKNSTGEIFFLVDNETPESPDYSPPGQVYKEAGPVEHGVFDTGMGTVQGPATDRWGVWISALAPLYSPGTGAVSAVLGIDVDANDWHWAVAARAAQAFGFMWLALILLATILCSKSQVGEDASVQPVMRRLLVPLALVLLLLVGGGGALIFRLKVSAVNETDSQSLRQFAGNVNFFLFSQNAAKLSALAEVLVHDPRLADAIRARDPKRLKDSFAVLFGKLRDNQTLTGFILFDRDRKVLLCPHFPEHCGKHMDSNIVRRAEAARGPVSGIEADLFGTYSLQVARPVYAGTELLGFLEIGMTLPEILADLPRQPGIEMVLTYRKKDLDQAAWERETASWSQPGDWERWPDIVLGYSSFGELPAAAAGFVRKAADAKGEAGDEVTGGGRAWRAASCPLHDANGNRVGEVLRFQDVTAARVNIRQTGALALLGITVLLAGIFAFLFVLLRRADRGIRAQQTAIIESEARYHDLFDYAIDGIYQTTPDGRILNANPALAHMFGYASAAELIRERLNVVDGYAEPGRRAEFRRQVEAAGSVTGFESEMLRRDGSRMLVSENARVVRDQSGRVAYYEGMMVDITDRRRVEAALVDSEERYRRIVENLTDALYIHDFQGRILDLNDQACRMVGYTREELLAGGLALIDTEENQALLPERMCRLLAEDAIIFEAEHRRKDGTLVPVEVSGKVVSRTGKGLIQGFVRDITERKRAGVELRASEELFRAIFEKHAAVKLLVDPADGAIVDANIAAEKFYGWSKEQLLKMHIFDINTLSAEEIRQEMDKAIRRQSVFFEFRHRQADGSVRDVAVFSSLVPYKGRPLLHSIVHDITDAKRDATERESLQEQLRQAQKIESVGRLAGGLAHDFNNMLGVIIGHAEMAMLRLDAGHPLAGDLREIQQAAERSAGLVRQLLGFARRQAACPQILNLGNTLDGMLGMLRRLIGDEITLEWKPAPDLWPVKIDPTQLDQILVNLCVNAKDAITGHGTIAIAAANISIDAATGAAPGGLAAGDYVLISVADNGCGMAAETQKHLFEPFFTTKPVGQGTGLGLATIYGIVMQNNGFIGVDSAVGRGTTFSIYLPRHVEAAQQKPAASSAAAPAPAKGGRTILLVEDEPLLLQMTGIMLQDLGYKVLPASSPLDALEIAAQEAVRIDLLLTDLTMPEMNGTDLAKEIIAIRQDIRYLYMSGYSAELMSRRGFLEPDVNFLEKPFTMQALAAKLEAIFSGTA